MISVQEAIAIVEKNSIPTTKITTISLDSALDYVLNTDVNSPIDMPPFRQSAMDGYALHVHDSSSYQLIGEVKAGDHHQPILKKGEAVRIFTGAAVPDSANAVIMQERVSVNPNSITIEKEITSQENIRPKGEQIQKGAVALKKGTRITPAAIGFLAGLGITEISVYQKPSIAIIVTGNELISPGERLSYGKIYESNAIMLQNALKSTGYKNTNIQTVADNYKDTYTILKETIATNDVVLVSGGISVGDYDFVGKALKELAVKTLFYKIKQRPGKPLFYGKKDDTFVFALPGNPASALNCFYRYAYPALQMISGELDFKLTELKAKLTTNYFKKAKRAEFLKAKYTNGEVSILEGQSSAMLQTFATANVLVYIPEEIETIEKGGFVTVILIPN